MKRLHSKKYTLLVGVLLLAAVSLIGWRGAQADWVNRLSDWSELSLTKARPESPPARSQANKPKLGNPLPAFRRVVNVTARGEALSGQPVASVATDLNEDGRPDLVTAFDNSLVTVRLGRDGGSFGAATPFSIDAQVTAMAAGDVTGDGHLDLLVTDTASSGLLILVGDGHGGLPQAQRITLPGVPSSLVVKNFKGDQRADVLVAISKGAQSELLLWEDTAWLRPMAEAALKAIKQRTLALTPTRLPVSLPGGPQHVDVGYVDSNSHADIIVVSEQQISVLFGDVSAPFQRVSTTPLEQAPLASVIGDFNGDVRAEVAILDSFSHDVIFYSTNPAGVWGIRERTHAGQSATALTVADINGDRVDDLIVVRPEAKQVAAFLGSREGRMGGELINSIQGEPVMALPAYLDGDELADLITIKQRGVSLLYTKDSTTPLAQGGAGDSPIVAIDPLELDVQVPEGTCRTVPVTITIDPTSFRPLDIYLLVDSTQSFNDNIDNFVRDGEKFVQELLDLRGDIRLGVGRFRDYPISPFGTLLDTAYRRVLDLQQVNVANRRRLIDAIKSIRTGGGGDDPEAHLPALFQTATGAGQEIPGLLGRASIAPDQQASFRRNVDVEKIVVLVTDSNFHDAGDPGTIPYPGPSFADTMAELNGRGIKVVGVASGGPGGDASITINALRQIAEATNSRARRDIDCDGDGVVDILTSDPIVCPPPNNGVGLKDVILSVVRGFDLPVPLTLEIDRDCSPITAMIDPPVQFVDPLTGGTFTFNITFCAPPGSAPGMCRFETKVILDEIIRARIPSKVTAVKIACDVTPLSLDFGSVCVGQNGDPQTITVTNSGNGDFTISQVLSDNPAFSVASTSNPLPAMLGAGESLQVDISFTCSTAGPQSGLIRFVTDPPFDLPGEERLCRSVPVTGFCTNISGDVTTRAIDFGNVCVGESAQRTFAVSNTGNQPFTIETVTSSNPTFSVAPAGGITIPAGGSTTFTVTFTCGDGDAGPQSGTISFTTSNADNCPFDLGTVNVSGSCSLITCDVAPRAIDFGEVCAGDTADQTFTVSNTGNGDFTINAINSSNPAFSIVSPALPATVPVGGNLAVTVRLTCTSSGPQTGSISFVTNSACGPVDCGDVTVSGTCLLITGDATPRAIDFGDVCVGDTADQTFTVSNTGNGPFTINAISSSNAAFSIVSPALPLSLNPGDSVAVTVRLTCTSGGSQSASISFASESACGAVDLGTVNVSGTCLLITSDVSPREINLGDICVGESNDGTFTVTNTGNGPFTVNEINSNNGSLTVTSPATPFTLNPGESTTVTVRFTCTQPGPDIGVLSFATQSACGPVDDIGLVRVSAFCVQVTGDVAPRAVDFGDVCIGDTADRTFAVSNTGNRPFTINAINSSNPAFLIVSPALPVSLNPGDSVAVTVRFSSTSGGSQSGAVSFVTDSACGPVDLGTVSLAGFGASITCDVAPRAIHFGNVCVGDTADRSYTVSNTGNRPFTINAINSSNGAFSIVSPALPVTVPAGGSVTVTVRLTCTSSGAQSSTISFVTDSACGPVDCGVVNVSGTCLLLTGDVAPRAIDYGDVCVGDTADRTFTVSNTGNGAFTINAINSSSAAFSIVSPALPITLPAGSSLPVTVRLSCTSGGPQSGVLSFNTDSACGAVDLGTVNLAGFCASITCDVGPRSIDFGNVFVGDTADRSYTVSNTGNRPFTINAINSSNAAFTILSPTLPVTVPPASSVVVTVRLSCTSPGAQSGTISFVTASACGPVDCGLVNLSGFCAVLSCGTTPPVINYGNVPVGSSADATATATNTGNVPFTVTGVNTAAPFSVVGTDRPLPAVLNPGESLTATIRFVCSSPSPVGGQETGQVTFVTDPSAGCPPVELRGFCEQFACAVAPAMLDFGAIEAGTSSDQLVTINNVGNVPYSLNGLSSSNGSFTVVSTSVGLPATIPPGGAVTATIRFSCPPGTSGGQSGAISFDTTPPSLCSDVPVGGECFVGGICEVSSAAISFGRIIVNTSQQSGQPNPNEMTTIPDLTISNTGDRPLEINDFVTSNPRCRVITPLPITIPVGGSSVVVIECEARELGPQAGTITFQTNELIDPSQCTMNFAFEGIFGPFCNFSAPPGTPPNFNYDTSFPEITLGDSTTVNGLVQLFNLGDLDLVVNKDGQRPVSTNLSFEVVSMAGLPLPSSGPVPEITITPGDFIEVLLRFTGVDVGPQQGAIRFFTNERVPDPNSPPCVLKNVNGNVVLPPSCSLSTDNITLEAFAACSSAQQTVTLSNVGGLNLVISDIQNGNPELEVLEASTGLPPALPITVPTGGSLQFIIRCTPLTKGTVSTIVRFITNDPNPNACLLRVTCVAGGGPICEVVMPDASPQPAGGAPDGKSFGQVVIAPPGNPLFGTVITDPMAANPPVFVGRKVLPIVVRNIGDAPLILGRDRNGNPTANVVTLTNTNYRVEGFNFDDVIPPGGEQAGTVIFEPSLRQLQVTTIRFFTNTCVGECVLTGVNGTGIAQAQCQLPLSLNVGTAAVSGFVEANFLLVNRGDRALTINNVAQIVSDNPRFTVSTPLPITVPPEFEGGESGVLITVRFTPTVVGEEIGRITFNFSDTQLTQVFPGTPAACQINVSGTGTASLSSVNSQQEVKLAGGNRPAR